MFRFIPIPLLPLLKRLGERLQLFHQHLRGGGDLLRLIRFDEELSRWTTHRFLRHFLLQLRIYAFSLVIAIYHFMKSKIDRCKLPKIRFIIILLFLFLHLHRLVRVFYRVDIRGVCNRWGMVLGGVLAVNGVFFKRYSLLLGNCFFRFWPFLHLYYYINFWNEITNW